jgi:hypothetical protein
MGVNQTSTNYLNDFYAHWYNYLTTKGKHGSFDQVILTTPNPNYDDAGVYGDYRTYALNADKFWVQQQQRTMARKNNYGLIDVAACSYIKRFGFDPRYCSMETLPEIPVFISNKSNKRTIPNDSLLYPFKRTDNPLYGTYEFKLNPSVPTNTPGFACTLAFGNILVQFLNGKIVIFFMMVRADL